MTTKKSGAESKGKVTRAERKSRSVLLHGYGGAALRVFGTYQLDDQGKPEKIVVRAFHRDSASEPWAPSDPSVHTSVEELEDEIHDWEMRATAIGYKRMVRRGVPGQFNKETIPVPPRMKPGTFTKGGIPDPLSVRHGGGLADGDKGRRGRR